jgi:hypothetical protein
MREQEGVAAQRPDEEMHRQPLGGVVGSVEHVAQSAPVEALAERRSRLQGIPVKRVKPIQPRLHQALHRAWYAGLLVLLGMTQQLLEEQRVAGGPVDAARGKRSVRCEELLSENPRLLWLQRAEMDGEQPARGGASAPLGAQRVTLGPRRENEECGTCRHGQRQLCRVRQR